MKEGNKSLYIILTIFLFGILVFLYYYIKNGDWIKEAAVYCEKSVMSELDDSFTGYKAVYLGNWTGSYNYFGSVESKGEKYKFSCYVKNKNDITIIWVGNKIGYGDETLEFNSGLYLGSILFDFESEEGRIHACEERAGYYLNFNEGSFTWNDEYLSGDSYVRTGHATYLKWANNAEDDVECIINKDDELVEVEFFNHMYNG